LVTPTVEDPPRDHEVEEKVNDPDNVDPVNATMGTCLQHFTDATQYSRHAQGENDGNEDGEIVERVHNAHASFLVCLRACKLAGVTANAQRPTLNSQRPTFNTGDISWQAEQADECAVPLRCMHF